MTATPAQQQAIDAQGNVLVVAGAGTGKTRTLVDRCLQQLLDPTQSLHLNQILMVTFTEAAASEMRERIGASLLEVLKEKQSDAEVEELHAHLDTASISTLHGYCMNLIRQHFHLLGLDPHLRILEQEEAESVSDQILNQVLNGYYDGDDLFSELVKRYVTDLGMGWDKGLREWVIQTHRFSQTLVNPADWIQNQLKQQLSDEPLQWLLWWNDGMVKWYAKWKAHFETITEESPNAEHLKTLFQKPQPDPTEFPLLLDDIVKRDHKDFWTPRKKTKERKPLASLFEESSFLLGLSRSTTHGNTPLQEEWLWHRDRARVILEITQQFQTEFKRWKLEHAAVDFSDLEQLALDLLWDRKTQSPTEIAQLQQQKFKHVYVDEYQDINAAQDCIISAVSGQGEQANRFLVGDVKQSIYGFRLANPNFFLSYERQWQENSSEGQVIYLQDNFRSHPGVLHCINSCFSFLMGNSNSGVAYDENTALKFGNQKVRSEHYKESKNCVHFEILVDNKKDESEKEETTETLSSLECEARRIASILVQMKEEGATIFDAQAATYRPFEWNDVLLCASAVRSRSHVFSQVFSEFGIPLKVPKSGLLERIEVTDLVALLRILDNPLQDIPLLAVLRSPLVGMTANELALMRMTSKESSLWSALNTWLSNDAIHEELPETLRSHPEILSGRDKARSFLSLYTQWRDHGRHYNVSRRMEIILHDTHYLECLATMTDGDSSVQNVRQLLRLARQFHEHGKQGISGFLSFLERKQLSETEFSPPSQGGQQVVELMSIHKSKGLEYPIVFVAGLGQQFNMTDIREPWMLHEEYGLSGMIQPPGKSFRYPSLPLWLNRQAQKEESLQEELRLLYVAFTRAKDRLIMIGSLSPKRWNEFTENSTVDGPNSLNLSAKNYLDWLLPWMTNHTKNPRWFEQTTSRFEELNWRIQDQSAIEWEGVSGHDKKDNITEKDQAERGLQYWNETQPWTYPHLDASQQTAKASVSLLKNTSHLMDTEESSPWFEQEDPTTDSHGQAEGNKHHGGTDRGLRHHEFLQELDLEGDLSTEGLKASLSALLSQERINPQLDWSLDWDSLASFWHSPLGQEIRQANASVHREMPFTARWSQEELRDIGVEETGDWDKHSDFVVIQGVIDLAVILEHEIWLLDYKSDQVTETEFSKRMQPYSVQLQLYAGSLEKIFKRPVTKKCIYFIALQRTVEI